MDEERLASPASAYKHRRSLSVGWRRKRCGRTVAVFCGGTQTCWPYWSFTAAAKESVMAKTQKMTKAQRDQAADKKAGIKPGSKQDAAIDKRKGIPPKY